VFFRSPKRLNRELCKKLHRVLEIDNCISISDAVHCLAVLNLNRYFSILHEILGIFTL